MTRFKGVPDAEHGRPALLVFVVNAGCSGLTGTDCSVELISADARHTTCSVCFSVLALVKKKKKKKKKKLN